jgi:hypothetical protein
MIYRNPDRLDDMRWLGEPNRKAGEMVRDFLSGERDLLELERGYIAAVGDLDAFLSEAEGRTLCVERAVTGEILVRAIGSRQSLLITGRTAEVIAGYIDETPVWMEDRFDMTLRRRVHLIATASV